LSSVNSISPYASNSTAGCGGAHPAKGVVCVESGKYFTKFLPQIAIKSLFAKGYDDQSQKKAIIISKIRRPLPLQRHRPSRLIFGKHRLPIT